MDRDVYRLLNDLIEHRLDAEQTAALEERLRNDPEVEAAYLELLSLHLDLTSRESSVRPFSRDELLAVQAVEECVTDRQELDSLGARPAPRPEAKGLLGGDRMRFGLLGLVLGTAASALIAVALVANQDAASTPQQQVASAEPSATSTDPISPIFPPSAVGAVANDGAVARIVKKIDCDWETDRWSVAPSASVRAGQQINLSRGLLVLEFSSGAELTLNGPVSLIASSGMGAKLLMGKLSARVPPSGRGFKIETHAGDFVDLGTEFGMIVSDDGGVETHVFKGKVIAEPVLAGAKQPTSILLETGAAWARPASGKRDETIDAQPELFVRSVGPTPQSRLDPPPVGGGLTLWLNASNHHQIDQKGNVSAWGDNTNEDNPTADDAWQVLADNRPEWVADAIGGQPALRFNGKTGLVTEPIHLGGNQTCAAVFSVNLKRAQQLISQRGEYKRLGVQLLNLNGPPHSVLQVNDDGRLEARVHMGWLREQDDPVDYGFTISDQPVDGDAHVALYTYDSENSIARLLIDGEIVAESLNAPEVAATTSPRFLGAHFEREGFGFAGDIAEILIYDAALSADQAQAVSLWLVGKYGVSR